MIGRAGVKVDLRATDARSGLRSLRVAVRQPGGAEQVLLDECVSGNLLSGGTRREQTAALQLDPAALGALKAPRDALDRRARLVVARRLSAATRRGATCRCASTSSRRASR